MEYAYGGHEFASSGIFSTAPLDVPGPVLYRTSIPLGDTCLPPEGVEELVDRLGASSFSGAAYHLLQNNCNTFAAEFGRTLTGAAPPPWINRLAGTAVALHCLLPTAWVPPLQPPTAPGGVPAGDGGGGIDRGLR